MSSSPTLLASRERRRCNVLSNAERKKISESQKKARLLLTQRTKEEAFNTLCERINANNGEKGPHLVRDVAKSYGISRDALYYMEKKAKAANEKATINRNTPTRVTNGAIVITPHDDSTGTIVQGNVPDTQSPTASTSSENASTTISMSRKQKIINEKKQKALVAEATTIAAQRFSDARKNTNGKVKNGTMTKIIAEVEAEKQLETGTINPETIKSRIRRGNLTGFNPGATSPLHQIEPFLAELCVRMSRMAVSMTRTATIELCTELIRNTPHATEYAKFVGKPLLPGETIIPGARWYTNFLKRNSNQLMAVRQNIADANRKTYCVKENFMRMYDHIYDQMTQAGVACELDEAVMLDEYGNQVYSEDEMYGCPTKYKMLHPENVLFMDETGCNTNQKKDGKVGGEKYIMPVDGSGMGAIGCTTDLHFSCACFTSGLGTPVMCAIIFASKKDISEIPISWKFGIDRTCNFDDDGFADELRKFFQNATQPGGSLSGGPTCVHNGKTIPCFYGSSPHGGITGQMLADMLKHLDNLHVYDRSSNMLPFLLLDGHNSRFSLEFLSYINDEAHEWRVCIGVPYGTHLWQPADSSYLNGTFKMMLTKAKLEYLRNSNGTRQGFSMCDIVPLVLRAWNASFANAEFGRKAIAERGWGPLNYVLLNHPQLVNPTSPSTNSSSTFVPEESLVHIDSNYIYINKNGKKIDEVLDQLVTRLIHDQGRIRAYEQRKANAEQYDDQYKQIKDLGRLSSGTITANNHFTLDRTLYLETLKRAEVVASEENERQEKREARNQKVREQVDESLRLFHADSSKMKAKDYRVLITHTRNHGESPTRKTLATLKEQFHRRDCPSRLHSIRYIPGTGSPTDVPETNTTVIDTSTDLEPELDLDGISDGISITQDVVDFFNNDWRESVNVSDNMYLDVTQDLFAEGEFEVDV